MSRPRLPHSDTGSKTKGFARKRSTAATLFPAMTTLSQFSSDRLRPALDKKKSNNMDSISILDINKNGVDLMRDGSSRQALTLFRCALQRLVEDRKNNAPQDEIESGASFMVRSVSSREVTCMSKLSSPNCREQHAFSLFDKAFVIKSADEKVLSSEMYRNRTLVVVLYNMALTYHLMGIRDANDQKKNLKRSMRYYRMAMEVLERNNDIDRKKIMSLAVSNNMGNIYSHLFETTKAQICLERMASALEAVYSDTPGDMGDAYSFFHLNVVIVLGQKEPAAPAA
jgi:hypothetical protein